MTLNFSSAARGLGAAALMFACLAGATVAHAEDRHVRIINETEHTMVRFYASNTGADSWEEDILGRDTLAAGQDVNINIDDGTGHCKFDFKAVFSDGTSLVRHNINVCEITSYRYTE